MKRGMTILISLFFILSSGSKAQGNGDFKWKADTSIIEMAETDTVSVDVDDQEPLPPPPVAEEATDDEESEQYFKYKWRYPVDSPVHQRNLPVDFLKQLKTDREFWYADSAFFNAIDTTALRQTEETRKEKTEPVQNGNDRNNDSNISVYQPPQKAGVFTVILWILIIGAFIGAIVWYLTSKDVKIFRKRDKKAVHGQEEGLSEEDIFAINYQREVEKAEKSGNYRLAIRLRFLRLLKVLSERNIIQYKQDKTNFDYLLQLQPTAYYNSFFRITRSYEYSWYGKFDVPESAYENVRNEFGVLEKQLTRP